MTITTPSPTHATGAHGCDCGCSPSARCDDPDGLARTRWFPRQVVGPDDLTNDQRYLREKHRRHNRMLHGWGVVCGCEVVAVGDAAGRPVPYVVCVKPGYVLGPYGDEILVDQSTTFDVRGLGDLAIDPCGPPSDPWCTPVRVDRDPGVTLYLAVRYDECPTTPVRAPGSCGCGCDDASCEHTRIRDGYELQVLTELPPGHTPPASTGRRPFGEAVDDLGPTAGTIECAPAMRAGGRPCPPCPTSPWVVLADLVIGPDGVVEIDPRAHRRWVASFGGYAFFCATGPAPVDFMPASPELTRVVGELFAPSSAPAPALIEAGTAGSLPASALRGAKATAGLRDLIGPRRIDELARVDPDMFAAAAEAAKISPDAARAIIDRARLVVHLGGGA